MEGGVPKLEKPFGTDLLLGIFVRDSSTLVFLRLRPFVGLSVPPLLGDPFSILSERPFSSVSRVFEKMIIN